MPRRDSPDHSYFDSVITQLELSVGIWVISELFYSYLKPYIEHQAEVTRCRVFNSIRYESTRTYYVMRVYRFDNRLLNRHEKEKIKHIEDAEIFFFPSISTRKSQPSKPFFFFDELRYSDVMLLTEEGYSGLSNTYISHKCT